MKRSLAIAALATLATGAAFAQTTIYGRLNTSVERVDANGSTTTQLVNNASRIGFKGSEDLGDGMKAGFQIEHGFSVDTGASTRANFWGRQSELWLSSTNMGTLRLGNYTSEAYFATADWVSMHNHDTGNSADVLYAYLGRDTNKIGWMSPDMKGLTMAASVSLHEGAANQTSTVDLAINYAAGPLAMGVGFEDNDTAHQIAVRASYEFGALTVGGYVQRDHNAYAAGGRTNVRLSAMYAMGLSEFHVNLGHADKYKNVADSSATQFTLAYNYNLSKRTKLFAFYTKVDDDAGLYTGKFSSLAAGVRHNF